MNFFSFFFAMKADSDVCAAVVAYKNEETVSRCLCSHARVMLEYYHGQILYRILQKCFAQNGAL